MAKQHDVLLFGATSFVGKLLIEYYLQLEDKSFSWAVAGRSKQKFEAEWRDSQFDISAIPFYEADSHDKSSLDALCERTQVIISTVGPYALYGEKLVQACVEAGVDYCDLTGEPQWILKMLERYESQAKQTGARIVHCSGFDSVPSDLGVYYLLQQIRDAGLPTPEHIKMRVKAARGGMSGGTVASLLNVMDEMATDPNVKVALKNPYCLSATETGSEKVRQFNQHWARYEPDFKAWSIPFIMAAINVRVVLRSQSLLPDLYGKRLRYDEAMWVGRGLKGRLRAYMMASMLGLFMVAAAFKPMRKLLQKTVLPKPGQGPSRKEQEQGFYDLRFFAEAGSETFQVKVVGDRDPGYGSTAKMLGQVGIALAQEKAVSQDGGFWTPAALLGEALIPRLAKNAGLTIARVGTESEIKRANNDGHNPVLSN